MRHKIVLLFVFCSIISFDLISQNALTEYKKILKEQKKSDVFSVNIDVVAFETRMDKTPEKIGNGMLVKMHDINYSKFNEQEMLYGEKYTIIVNHELKTIDYYEHQKSKRPKLMNDFIALIDSTIAEMGDGFKYYGIKNNLKMFSIVTPEDIIEQTDLYFDTSNNLLTKVAYTYGESSEDYETSAALVIINYKDYQFQNVQLKKSRESFVVLKGNSWVGAGIYKLFKVNYFKA